MITKPTTDLARDDLLTEFGKSTLKDRYLLPDEDYQGMFARVASYFSDDNDHAQRIYDYMSSHWFMPSTPILSNNLGIMNPPVELTASTTTFKLAERTTSLFTSDKSSIISRCFSLKLSS